ncbi:MAG: hypothetical protein WC584_03600 [Candidatus Pacearchaeota archaeon]
MIEVEKVSEGVFIDNTGNKKFSVSQSPKEYKDFMMKEIRNFLPYEIQGIS